MPAIVTLELRAEPVFCTTVTFDAPLVVPVPSAPTQAVLDEDDQEHPLVVVMVTLADPAAVEKLRDVGETEYEHGGGVDPPVPSVAARNCVTTGTVRFSATAFFLLVLPVGRPL